MRQAFTPSEWTVVLPRRRNGLFDSRYLEPVSIVAQETGSDLEECLGCGQLRERVSAVLVGEGLAEVCVDCRQKYGL